MMAGIWGKGTPPEMTLRPKLHNRGFRFRLRDRRLPGSPDLVFAGHRESMNAAPDKAVEAAPLAEGWSVLTKWQYAIKEPEQLPMKIVLDHTADWLVNDEVRITIEGAEYGGI
jgi:DNA mismatch endonuclease (patch repair protein)